MPLQAKICGVNAREALAAAAEADYVGFVFYPPSPRAVSASQAGTLAAAAPPRPRKVGLFVDADDDAIAEAIKAARLDLLQLHGKETPQRVAELRTKFRRSVVKAIPIAEARDFSAAAPYIGVADILLFDAKPPLRAGALPGGNATSFDWNLLAGRSWRIPWWLSGGLTADNLGEAVRASGARAVDVSSGVEDRPGHKDPARIRAFLAAARSL